MMDVNLLYVLKALNAGMVNVQNGLVQIHLENGADCGTECGCVEIDGVKQCVPCHILECLGLCEQTLGCKCSNTEICVPVNNCDQYCDDLNPCIDPNCPCYNNRCVSCENFPCSPDDCSTRQNCGCTDGNCEEVEIQHVKINQK